VTIQELVDGLPEDSRSVLMGHVGMLLENAAAAHAELFAPGRRSQPVNQLIASLAVAQACAAAAQALLEQAAQDPAVWQDLARVATARAQTLLEPMQLDRGASQGSG
jgi:hypothetical protein